MDNHTHHPTLFNNPLQTALPAALEHLATLFWGPTPESCQEMAGGTFWEPFEALAPYLKIDLPDTLVQIKQACSAFKSSTELFDCLETEYVAAFINRYGGIRASLYASSYYGDNATLMAEPARLMEKRFASKGLKMATERNEPPDHLAIQLEFGYFLLTQEKSDTAKQEAAQFVNETLLPWVPHFYARLRTEGPSDFYALTAALLMALLNLIAELE